MRGKKKAIMSVGVTFAVATVFAALCGCSWQEPKASYVPTDDPKLQSVREDLAVLKSELREKGLYSCCIRNDCNWCAIYMGHCPCAELVSEKGNEKSCPECAAAWNKKQGRIPGVDPEAIQVTTFGVYGFEKGGHHQQPPEMRLSGSVVDGVRVIGMKARRFEFDPSTIAVRQGEKVRLEVTSEDVTHGIVIDSHDIARKLEPGKTEAVTFTAGAPGHYRFRCSVYCGRGHNDMHGELVVLDHEG